MEKQNVCKVTISLSKLKCYLETKHPNCVSKPDAFFS